MLKARSGDILIFGLSDRNIELLQQGRPIKINLRDIGATGTVILFHGKTEEQMKASLEAQGIQLRTDA